MAIISVRDVSKSYKVRQQQSGFRGTVSSFFHPTIHYVQAIKNLSFEIEAGEFIGFIGENGAGKSTMIKMMSGILYPTSGEIQIIRSNALCRRSSPQFPRLVNSVISS